MFVVSDGGYHQLLPEEEEINEKESFFNSVSDYGFSHSNCQFRFCLPGQNDSDEYKQQILGFFKNEPCPYNHQIFGYAAAFFDVMKHPDEAFQALLGTNPPRQDASQTTKPKARTGRRHSSQVSIEGRPARLPDIEFASEKEKRLTYQLVFQTLKYQKFLQEMLKESMFFENYPEHQDEFSSVMVILCDYKLRKFQRRMLAPDEVLVAKMSEIEEALYRSKTKLNAALARSRIKSRVLSIDWLLPDSVRKNEKIGCRMHVTCWVNFVKTNMSAIKSELEQDGFTEVMCEEDFDGKTFMVDDQCSDVLTFPNELISCVEKHPLVTSGALVLQDKSSSVGVHTVRRMMSDDDDVLLVNVGSGLTAAHIASLSNNCGTNVYAYGITSDRHQKNVGKLLDKLGVRSRVKLMSGNFVDASVNDEKLRDIKIVFMTALCSKSGVANPVSFVVTEGEDIWILRDLSLGQADINKVGDLVTQHTAALKHAFCFPRVQGVVYFTRSLVEMENENVVNSAIEYVTTVQQTKMPYRVSPPVLPLTEFDVDDENPLSGKFLKFMPSNFSSGCFIAAITREADDPKEAAKGILARAAARGIIAGVQEKLTAVQEHSVKKHGERKDAKRKSKKTSKQNDANPAKKLSSTTGVNDSSSSDDDSDNGIDASTLQANSHHRSAQND